ncbi:MAG: hypothetical protein HFH31_02120, partial [Bacilli bacterium]|nr:hypothetical protein [Bacilli bacterium]
MTLDTLKIINSVWIDICRYTDSKFIPSHNYEQLPPEIIQEHAKIYSKVLKKRKIDLQIHLYGYKKMELFKRLLKKFTKNNVNEDSNFLF